ncbi:putative bifunctional diguanylate cyclase/phosphodiesterase [Uliginosibacterium paludis]|uniref:EAL domain-containing protein n=1 Tax=Uliginosibacterium paludis TaxID=1615952 RepID=A0ABV2CPD0_9RHOO
MKRWRMLTRRARFDLYVFVVSSVLLASLMIHQNAFEGFFTLSRTHESWQLDEIAIVFCVLGALGYVYAVRRMLDLRAEVRMRQVAEREARELAARDLLTGVPNRRALHAFFDAMFGHSAAPEPFFLAILDLDGFKAINDLYGHLAGDALLRCIAGRLKAAVPVPDFVCRLAGDEFALVIRSQADAARVRARVEAIAEVLQQPIVIEGHELQISATFGMAAFPADGDTLGLLLRRADVALCQGKTFGRATVRFFNEALDRQIESRSRIEAALRQGLEQNRLFVHFQPIVDLASGRIAAFEALARLTDPELGSISPLLFIEAAEHTGLILKLSDHLLRLACETARQWPQEVHLSFNLSPRQLRDPMLVRRLLAILTEAGFPPQRLELEVTESGMISDADGAEDVLRSLRAEGIRIAIDDFGAGYSSFARLSRFAFERIKIDRSFVNGLGSEHRAEPVLASVIHLIDALGSISLAEGIETQAQLDWLRAHGCRFGQGYLLGRPEPAESTLARLRAQRPD